MFSNVTLVIPIPKPFERLVVFGEQLALATVFELGASVPKEVRRLLLGPNRAARIRSD